MKALPLLPALVAGLLLFAAPQAAAASAMGMTEAEMADLYGKDFAKQAMQARELMDQDWNEDLEDEDDTPAPAPKPAEPAPAPSPAPAPDPGAEPAPAIPAVDAPAPPRAEPAPGKMSKRQRKKLMASTIALVKAKRSVDAKIKSSRSSIKMYRAKVAALTAKSGKLSNLDHQAAVNCQKNIRRHKAAVPELVSFSYELKEQIDSRLVILGLSGNPVIKSYDPADVPDKTGCESQNAPEDTRAIK